MTIGNWLDLGAGDFYFIENRLVEQAFCDDDSGEVWGGVFMHFFEVYSQHFFIIDFYKD